MKRTLRRFNPYLIVTLAVAATYLFKVTLLPAATLFEIPFLSFFSAVVVAGIFGGFWVGIYATFLSAAFASYFFMNPVGELIKTDWNSNLKILLYVVDCVTIAGLCGKLKASRKSAHIALEARDNFFSLPKFLFAMADSNGYFLEVNDAWCELLGFSKQDLLREPFINFVHPEDVERTRLETSKLRAGLPSVQFTNRYLTVDGDYRWLMWSVNPIGDMLYAAARDVTDLKDVERELILAKDSAEQANDAKSKFLANMSHEIRTPLGVIMGFAELASESEGDPAEVRSSLERITRNSRHLAEIVDEILDLAKIEANKLEIDRAPLNLSMFLHDLTDWVSARAKERGLQLQIEIPNNLPAAISTDATKLRQILTNVLGNALKFTELGEIKFLVGVSSDVIEFLVEDSGIGMSPEHQRNLFKAFTQADGSITRKFGGTGLGLALSKKLALALGGDLTLVGSELGFGSTFRLTVPALAQPLNLAAAAEQGLKERALDAKRILLVEDSLDNQALIGTLLSAAGAKVDFAENGKLGMQLALANDFDAIVMDIQMPVLDGREATRELRARGFTKPIIGLSAHAFKGEREKAFRDGFSEYLTKPISRVDLIKAIEILAP